MSKNQIFVFCKKNDIRYGDVYFQKGTFYPAEFVHDLLLFTGDKGNMMQIEGYSSNDYFQEFFALVLSMSATPSINKIQAKIRA